MVKRSKTSTEIFETRSRVLAGFLVLSALGILFRLMHVQVWEGDRAQLLAQEQHSVYRKLLPSRGEIIITGRESDQGYPVATTVKKYLVYAVPGEVVDADETAQVLSDILGVPKADVLDKITRKEKKYVPIKKLISEDEERKIREGNFPGIYFDSEDTRAYPENTLLAQVLGFVGYKKDTREGLYGLEKAFEKELAGSAGFLEQEKDAGGAWIFGARREMTPAVDGVSLLLTIDKSIQFKAESVLKEAVESNEADSGSVVVVDPKTGAVLAMATYPTFDPNAYNKVEDPNVYLNEATLGNYEPGSVFKPLTMAAAMEEGKITPNTSYNDSGSVNIDGYTIKNSDNKAHGMQTMTEALEKSLNTGVIFAKDQIGNKSFYDYIKKFGFGEPTNIELPEMKGNLDNLKANIAVNYHTASFGQGISVTPIQLIQAFTALANNGHMMRPYIVQAKLYPDGRTLTNEPQKVRDVISAKTASQVTAMMVNVIERGHGKRAGVAGYYIAGKTGTAQVPKKNGRGYEENNNIGSFIGYGPVEDPKFLMLVRINHPRTVSFAESTAAPAFGKIAEFILSYMNIPPTRK